ncbi:MAG TPA: hypothetical protein VF808_02825 [Ktedonobacterales bacterium]
MPDRHIFARALDGEALYFLPGGGQRGVGRATIPAAVRSPMDAPQHVAAGQALIRLGLAGLFVSVPRLALRIEAHGLELDTRAPRTIYAITHKRDPDTFVSPPILLSHRGWSSLIHDVRFIMRADAFQTGFLARLIERPDWLRRAIRPFSVGAVLRGAGVDAIEGFHSRPAELWIRDAAAAYGDMPIATLLTPEALQELAQATGAEPAALGARSSSALKAWRYAAALQIPTGSGILAGQARRDADRRLIETARAQLRAMTDWLNAGGSLFLAPEGHLSTDGLLSPARAGLRLILNHAPPDTRIQPVAIMYDSLTTGRLRVILDLAPPILEAQRIPSSQLDERLRAAWLGAARATCSQLATAALVALHVRPGDTSDAKGHMTELAAATHQLALALSVTGQHVDAALLGVVGTRQRVARYLRNIARRRLGSLDCEGAYTIRRAALPSRADAPDTLPDVPPGGVGYDLYPLRYAWNEAFEMLTAAGVQPAAASRAAYTAGELADWPATRPFDFEEPKKA